ncbi:MAG: HlyD family type I secretion periplasmic adaptor subunit [Pseudomonadota bacterium]
MDKNNPAEVTAAAPESRLKLPLSGLILCGVFVAIFMLGGFSVWASVAKLSGAVIAPGVVKVDSNRKTVQHLEGGIVSELLVTEGDRVSQGQLLVRLDTTRTETELAVINGELNALEARFSRLNAEQLGHREIAFPERLLTQQQKPEVADLLEGQQRLFDARRDSFRGEIELLKQTIERYHESIGGLTAQVEAKATIEASYRKELVDFRSLYEQGSMPITPVLSLERSVATMQGESGEHLAEIAAAKKAISETELKILQHRKDFRESVENELSQLQTEIHTLSMRRVAVRDQHRRTEIRAPQAGVVLDMAVHTTGGVIAPGEKLLDIVPESDSLVIESRIATDSIERVRIGSDAVVRLSALDVRSTPELNGTIVRVSADSLVDQYTGIPYYNARLQIPAAELDRLNGIVLVPGMPAEVFIKTTERTLVQYLTRPLTDSVLRAFRER